MNRPEKICAACATPMDKYGHVLVMLEDERYLLEEHAKTRRSR